MVGRAVEDAQRPDGGAADLRGRGPGDQRVQQVERRFARMVEHADPGDHPELLELVVRPDRQQRLLGVRRPEQPNPEPRHPAGIGVGLLQPQGHQCSSASAWRIWPRETAAASGAPAAACALHRRRDRAGLLLRRLGVGGAAGDLCGLGGRTAATLGGDAAEDRLPVGLPPADPALLLPDAGVVGDDDGLRARTFGPPGGPLGVQEGTWIRSRGVWLEMDP